MHCARPDKQLVLRVNRLFESDGDAGIRRFERIIDRYTRAGFDTELQVRYHPSARQRGNIAAWTRYVRHVVDVFGPNRRVIAMTITNEINLPFSPNTSDGAYPDAEQALIAGDHRRPPRGTAPRLQAAAIRLHVRLPLQPGHRRGDVHRAADVAGRRFARRSGSSESTTTRSCIRASTAGSASPAATVADARHDAALLHEARRSRAAGVPLWVTESGYDTRRDRHRHAAAAALVQIVDAIRGAARTYGVTDYRWFNLRDNLSTSTGFAQTTGLLTDDYRAQAVVRGLPAADRRGSGHARTQALKACRADPGQRTARTWSPTRIRSSSRMSARRPPRWTSCRRTWRDA